MDLETIVAHFGADATQFNRVTNQVESRLTALSQRFGAAAAGGGLIGGVIGAGVGTGMVSLIAAIETPINLLNRGLATTIELTTGAIDRAVQLGMEYQKTAIAFEVMAGSKEKGNRLLEGIQELAVTTPYKTGEMGRFGEMLLGYGVEANAVIPALSRLGDIAAGNTEKFRRLALAFGQVYSAGRFMGQEKRQFAEAGVGLEDFAKTANMTGQEFLEAMKKGEIGADIMVKTINRLTSPGGRFFDLSRRINVETVSGQIEEIEERIEMAGRRLSIRFFEAFNVSGRLTKVAEWLSGKGLETELSPWIDRLKVKFDEIEPRVVKLAASFQEWLSDARPSAERLAAIFEDFGKGIWEAVRGSEHLVPTWAEVNRALDKFKEEILPVLIQRLKEAIDNIAALTKKFGEFLAWATDQGKDKTPGQVYTGEKNQPLGIVSRTNPLRYLAEGINKDKTEEGFDPNAPMGWWSRNNPIRWLLGMTPEEIKARDALRKQSEAIAEGAYGTGVFVKELPGGPARFGINPWTGLPADQGMIPGGAPNRIGLVPPPEVITWTQEQRKLIDALTKDAGVGKFADFEKSLGLLDQIFGIPQKKREDWLAAGRMGAMPAASPITGGQFELGLFNAYQKLESAFSKAVETKMAPAARAGTSESADIINRSMMSSQSVQDRMLAVMEAAKAAQLQELEQMRLIVPELKKMSGGKGVVGKKP